MECTGAMWRQVNALLVSVAFASAPARAQGSIDPARAQLNRRRARGDSQDPLLMGRTRASTGSRPARAGAALLLLFATCTPAAAQSGEAAVKAAFLARFADYVEWPSSRRLEAGDPVFLCVVGADPFGRMIDDAVRGQQVDGHPLAVKRLAGAEGAEVCRLAFVEGGSARATADLLAALRGKPVLTVTDASAGPARGIIHFMLYRGRVRFAIDQAEAVRCGLALNSRLLGVALSVKAAR
jgi:hypothetical protein